MASASSRSIGRAPPPAPGDRERGFPPGYRARHGVGREGTPGRNRVEPSRSIPLGCGPSRGRTAGIDRDRFRSRCVHDPEAVAADGVHVRVDDGDGGGGGDHRFDGVAALAQHREPGLGGEMVRGDDHTPGGSGGVGQFLSARVVVEPVPSGWSREARVADARLCAIAPAASSVPARALKTGPWLCLTSISRALRWARKRPLRGRAPRFDCPSAPCRVLASAPGSSDETGLEELERRHDTNTIPAARRKVLQVPGDEEYGVGRARDFIRRG